MPADNAFYFRVSGLNLYYTETQKDMIVLGAIAIDNIVSPSTVKKKYISYIINYFVYNLIR